ncbi:MAG: PAS domain S-box protein [Bacteroidetes bacterium]|nr:PAS domain S-box protein [Bacteroidota bacterium]
MRKKQGAQPAPIKEILHGVKHYEALFKYSLDAILFTSPDGRIFDANPKACELLGMTRQEICETGRKGIIDTNDPRLAAALEERERNGFFYGELTLIRKDGTRFPVELTSAIFMDESGIKATSMVFRDITDRKKAEFDILTSQAHLKSIIESTGTGILSVDNEGHITHANQTFIRMLRIPEDIIKSGEDANLLNYVTDQVEQPREFLSKINKLYQSAESDTDIVRFRDGRVFERFSHPQIVGEEIIGRTWGFLDITENIEAEKSLHEVNDYLESLLNYANAPIIVWDPHFHITRFNHAFESLTGLKEADVIGQSIDILFPEAQKENSMALIRKTSSGERWETVEIIIQHIDGAEHTVLWNSATLFSIDDKTPVATIAQGQEITKRKKAEEEIRLKNEELRKINAEKDKFFSILAHDLRSPFHALLGFTQLLDEELTNLSPDKVNRIVGGMRKSVTNLFRLIENLLEWSRVQQGAVPYNPQTIRLKPLVEEVTEMVKVSAIRKDITVSVSVQEDVMIIADAYMFSAILRNILFNAVKFTAEGGKVNISTRTDEDNKVKISISDTGIGMSPIMISNLFRLDKTSGRKGTAGEPSTGLGLIISKDFVEKHGGLIIVQSEEGKGSIFTIVLPN